MVISLTEKYQFVRSEIQWAVEDLSEQLEWAKSGTDLRYKLMSEYNALVGALDSAEKIITGTNKKCRNFTSRVERHAWSFIVSYQTGDVDLKALVNEAFCSITTPATINTGTNSSEIIIMKAAIAASAEIFKIQTGVKPEIMVPA